MEKIKESDLYEPIKEYLDSLGYNTKGEVLSCDIAAVKGDELIVIELKKGFTMELIYQALKRQKAADSVYVAVPIPKRGYKDPHYNDMVNLCKRLELGLILVGFTTNGKPQIDVAVNPAPAKSIRHDKKKRMAILTEHSGRTGSVNTGGVTRRKIITVYKEQALFISKLLSENGELSAKQLRELGGGEKTSSILRMNYYKWFEKIGTGKNVTYRITDMGISALEEYKDLFEKNKGNTSQL